MSAPSPVGDAIYNPYLPHSLRTQRGVEYPITRPTGKSVVVFGEDGAPIGTSVQVREWVGNDVERAKIAMAHERKAEKPRITLLAHLASLVPKEAVTRSKGDTVATPQGSQHKEVVLSGASVDRGAPQGAGAES